MSGKDLGSEMADMAANLEESTGRNMSWWINTAISSDKTKHGETAADLEEQHGLTHRGANLVAHVARQSTEGGPASPQDQVSRRPKQFALI